MKSTFKLFFITLVAVIGFSMAACSNGTSGDPPKTVYVAGFYDNGGVDIACYWKNGIKTDLATINSEVYAIAVTGSDVYTAGWYVNGPDVACYWKGTTKTDLSTVDSRANGIVVK